jgi:hypothetical protein
MKTYFHLRSNDWKLIKTYSNPKEHVIESCLFKHSTKNVYLLADAYDGEYIAQTMTDFLRASSGLNNDTLQYDTLNLIFGGNADLVSFIGHNGLLDFDLDIQLNNYNKKPKDVIILSCFGRQKFTKYIRKTGANPLVWSTGLMSAEAYPLEWALDGWVLNETDLQIRERAAKAYNNYQKCGLGPAKNLLVTGY